MPEYNKSAPAIADFHPAPEWLTKDYLQNALQVYFKDESLKIHSLDITPATAKGENYASVMTRVRVEYTTQGDRKPQTGSYIAKTSFEGDEFASEKLKQYDIYNREMEIYEKILPKLNSLLKEINDDDKMFADTIAVDYENCAIIFEDLSIKSFILAERTNGLDLDHTKMVLRKLAKMHATSAVLNERVPDTFKSYDRGMFNRHTEAFSPFFVNTLDACGQMVSQWENFKEYGAKLLHLKPVLMEYGKRVFDAKDNHLNVLIHGDLWTNNVMFTYDDNKHPNDVIMIDFQYACWTSPAVDLHYFFNTSLREEIRLHQQDELVEYYYYILTDTLKALKFNGKIPSLHEFWIQYTEKSFYAFTSACLVQPVMLNEETEDADFHSLMGEDERSWRFRHTIYKNEKVQKNLKRLLPFFNLRGMLDIQ